MKLKRRKNGKSVDLKKTHETKTLSCSKGCGQLVKVDSEVESVICWRCTAKSVPGPEYKSPTKPNNGSRKPKGWHWLAVYVDPEGNVFHKGEEKPELKGTLPPTPLKAKKTKAEKDAIKEKKEAKLAKLYEKKQLMKEKENEKRNAGMGTDLLQ